MKWASLTCCLVLAACRAESNDSSAARRVQAGVQQIGRIEHPRLTESSGVVVSRKDPTLFWTHNDGGGKRQVLYAMTREGKPVAEFRVTGAVLDDWEDIAADDQGHLFLGDIGNNDAKRSSIAVYQVSEPAARTAAGGVAPVTRAWHLRYPAAAFDCESLLVWRDSGYLVSKVFNDERAHVYRFSLTNDAPFQTLEAVGELRIDSPVTGADISRDGRLLGIVAKNGAYLYSIQGDISRAVGAKPFQKKLKHEHIEACTFVPEGVLTTAESREIFLFNDEPFRTGAKLKK
jgi:hypothetical protein